MKVFVNYKQNVEPDHSFAKAVESRLRDEGHQVFRDETRLKSGDQWPAKLEKEVRCCHAMVSLISNRSLRSTWVLNEIDLAKKLGKRMLPYLMEEIDESLRFQALNPYFMSTHWTVLTGNELEDLATIAAALAEPRHACYRELIDAKLNEHGIKDAKEVLEVLCGLLWHDHWPAALLGTTTTAGSSKRLNGEIARSLTEALRNDAETVASMNDQNASAYLKDGETSIASRMSWQVQRLRCVADIIDSLLAKWNEACEGAKKRIKTTGCDNSPIFDTSDGERAFAPLDEHSSRARHTPAPTDLVTVLHLPQTLHGERQLGRAVRLCEFLDEGSFSKQGE